ncbi:hypothetical protein B4589_010260 [Halolamina sp. CBA1230]|uniref:HGGxSTG domain-containing protein n=1 Tax=Halolamina sp. CBA1230 TaxID=1853690 RepID=UPI0009A18EFF|nr:HGGxSTG domain-containing protein [Halolamina sp. CBA1230]QKY20743.1 hypothetical protein B4589_010260 [Halolamina sp. CBA1230]
MSTKKTGDTDGRYSDICGATNNRGEPCSLPAGWGTPGSGGTRCRFHGGASTGPDETDYLEENDFAEGNAGGGAPELNTNSRIHGGFGDWEKAYERFDADTRAYVHKLIESMREVAKEYAPGVDADRRERLLKEKATLSVMYRRTAMDTFDAGRGFLVEEEHNGEAIRKANPAFDAGHAINGRQREIAKELRLWPGFQD